MHPHSRRSLSFVCSGVVAALILALGGAPPAPASAQDSGWEVPRTPHGHPDLQGNWSNATLTPFERPEGQGPVLTPEQVAAIEGDGPSGNDDPSARPASAQAPDDRPLPPGGDHPVCIDGATTCYNEVYRDPGDGVAVVDGEPRSSLLTEPGNGRIPELTPAGRERVAAYRAARADFDQYDHPELRPLGERCILSFGSSAGPPMLPNYWYNNNYTIVQTPDHVAIMAEMVHDTRIIQLGDSEPPPKHVRPWFGHSRGRWVGDTLVVETTNIHPDQLFRGVPPSEDVTVIERFHRVDEETLLYRFRVQDPTTYEEPWGGEIPFVELNDRLYEYACHEGNYSLENVLRGARYEERQEESPAPSEGGPEASE